MTRKARIAGQIVNCEELAGILGISRTTVDAYIRAGCPVIEEGAGRRGYKLNTADIVAWRDRRKDEAQSAIGETTGDQAKRRYTQAQAELKELQLAEKRKLMVSIEDVVPILADELANVRSRLMAMPGRLAVELAAVADPVAIERIITDEIAAALSEITQA